MFRRGRASLACAPARDVMQRVSPGPCTRVQVTSLVLGKGKSQKDKIFVAAGNQVRRHGGGGSDQAGCGILRSAEAPACAWFTGARPWVHLNRLQMQTLCTVELLVDSCHQEQGAGGIQLGA